MRSSATFHNARTSGGGRTENVPSNLTNQVPLQLLPKKRLSSQMEDPFLNQLASSPNKQLTTMDQPMDQTFELVESSPVPNSGKTSEFYMWGYSPDFNMKKNDDEVSEIAAGPEMRDAPVDQQLIALIKKVKEVNEEGRGSGRGVLTLEQVDELAEDLNITQETIYDQTLADL